MGMKTQSTTVLIAVSILAAAFSVQKQFQTKKYVYVYVYDFMYIYHSSAPRQDLHWPCVYLFIYIYTQIILYHIILYYIILYYIIYIYIRKESQTIGFPHWIHVHIWHAFKANLRQQMDDTVRAPVRVLLLLEMPGTGVEDAMITTQLPLSWTEIDIHRWTHDKYIINIPRPIA